MKLLKSGMIVSAIACMVLVGGNRRAEARVSSPGNVTFSNPNSPNTTAVFDSTGTFTLQLSVTDGSAITNKIVIVTVNAAVLPKVCTGSGLAIAGNRVDVGIDFSTGTLSIAGLQFDLALPPGVSSNTVTAGTATTAAGKAIQTNIVGTSLRFIISGFNQNVINAGNLGTINLILAASLPSSSQPLVLANIVGSDPAGNSVPMSSCNGTLTVTANQAPTVTIGANQTITFPAPASLTSSSTDDGAPNPPGTLAYSWSVL